VFIVGMPRSGTTLVERIIGSHPLAAAGGERRELTEVTRQFRDVRGNYSADPTVLQKTDFVKHARTVLRKFQAVDPKAERIVDKMPSNFIRLNIIAKLFPKARIIHTTRDPRDTCLSCFFQSFTGVHPYAYDLAHLGQFYRIYQELISHFIDTLGIEVLEVPYESVVADQEGWSRKIIDHIGLDWHDDCLRFYEKGGTSVTSSNEQVRKPIYTSSMERWRKYETHLGPLIEALDEGQAPS